MVNTNIDFITTRAIAMLDSLAYVMKRRDQLYARVDAWGNYRAGVMNHMACAI